jgi:zinc transport system substrate-binding protein
MKWILSITLSGLMLAGCSKQKTESLEKGKPVIYTVNYPLAYFAERIAGDAVTVVFPDMEGDPAFWEPSAEQVVQFQDADLVLLNGASYAKWIPKVSLPQSSMLNTAAGLEEKFIELDGTVTHTHGPGGAHAHGDFAFTLWLNPELAMHQAQTIHAAFAEKWNIESNGLTLLMQDLKALDESWAGAFKTLGAQPLLGSHPVYQYLAQRYELNMESVHWEPDAEPDAVMWRELDDILEVHPAKIMLWEDEPLPAVKETLKQRGIRSVIFNPCGNRPDEENYLDVMRKNLSALKRL